MPNRDIKKGRNPSNIQAEAQTIGPTSFKDKKKTKDNN
jgi:hypothetical protein